MLFDLLLSGLVFVGILFGLGWPLVHTLALVPVEKIVACITLSLVGVWTLAWTVYVCGLPTAVLFVIPVIAAAGLWVTRRSLLLVLRDPEVGGLLVNQLFATTWCLGWLSLVVSYSGGDWVGDWFGHWDRTRFFLERWPRDILFTGFDPLPSRPPLVNVVTGVLLHVTKTDFAQYQLVTTLLGTLVFLPAALLVRRFGSPKSGAILVMLLMLNPLFVQNATYAWTKLPAAFFVLTAVYFFLRAADDDTPRIAAVLFALSLGAGVLAHYSAGPYAVALTIGWGVLGWRYWRDRTWRGSTGLALLIGAIVIATWFGWAFAIYGGRGTFLSNTAVLDQAPTVFEQWRRIVLNIRDTLVPHFLRPVDFGGFLQRSPWGEWRDWAFLVWQRNVLFAVGSVAWVAILVELARDCNRAGARSRVFWTSFVVVIVLLGVAVHAGRDNWGNTAICLQPLIVLGIAYLAARWERLSRAWRRAVIAGATVDFTFGIALHFGVQSHLLDRWVTPARAPADYLTSYSEFSLMNLRAKNQLGLRFFSELLPARPELVLALLIIIFIVALARVRAAPSSESSVRLKH